MALLIGYKTNKHINKMALFLPNFVNCETIQDRLSNQFGCDYTQTLKQSEASLVQFLFSPANTMNTLQKQVDGADGKLHDVKLVYTSRIPDANVGTAIDTEVCASVQDHGQLSKVYTLDENVGVTINRRIKTENLIRFCEDDQTYMEKMLLQMMDANIRKMDKLIGEQAILLAGNFGAGETGVTADVKSVRTRKTAISQDISTNFIEEIDFASENAGYCGPAVILGFYEIYKAFKGVEASNCCSDAGINIAQLEALSGTTFIPNKSIPAAFANNANFLGIDAGALQVLTYNRYMKPDGSIMVINDGTTQRTTIIHPIYGIPFDYRMDYNCGVYSFFVELAFKTVGMPDDLYQPEDTSFVGVTGVNKYIVDNA